MIIIRKSQIVFCVNQNKDPRVCTLWNFFKNHAQKKCCRLCLSKMYPASQNVPFLNEYSCLSFDAGNLGVGFHQCDLATF